MNGEESDGTSISRQSLLVIHHGDRRNAVHVPSAPVIGDARIALETGHCAEDAAKIVTGISPVIRSDSGLVPTTNEIGFVMWVL